MKKVQRVYDPPAMHWVGDGFPVRSLFSYSGEPEKTSPFLMLDYAGPARFEPAARPRGVGEHPHRGFETVTIVYQGEVEHRDSTGSGGHIGPGDVQWMTAASGILHDEFHSPAFTEAGGTLEMVQLWVNLPAEHKMAPAGYQTLLADAIPTVGLADDAGSVRVIAGEYGDRRGPARTFTDMHVWDVRLRQGKSATFDLPENWTAALVVLHGTILVNAETVARDAQLVMLERSGTEVTIEANNDVTLLLLSGTPIDEPVVGYGPFVMNTRSEIQQAIQDFNQGRFGAIDAARAADRAN